MDDLELLGRINDGDETAFAELFRRHRAAVYRYAVHLAGRADGLPDDIVQDVFLAFLRRLERFDPARGSIESYLLGIARRQIFRQLDRRRGTEALDVIDADAAMPSLEASALQELTRVEAVARVRAAVGALPPVFREAVVLCELNELDYAAAASVMNCPIGTVRSRLHRGRALLAAALTDLRPVASVRRASK